jgi:hypothetical protein
MARMSAFADCPGWGIFRPGTEDFAIAVPEQVHRGQDLLGDVLGLDEGDEAQLGVAL